MVVRAWEFPSAEGAGTFLDWLVTNATHSVIGEARPVEEPAMFVHEPSGCCHEETPVYLSAWQKGDVVWTVGERASDPDPARRAAGQAIEQEV